MRLNIHRGHNQYSTGASSILNELHEADLVKNELINLLKDNKHTVYDCTDSVGRNTSENLYNIVAKCNAHDVDLDVSIHLNAGRNDKRGDGSTGGVEVWVYDTNTIAYETAKRVCEKIAKELGVTNRGVKISKDFYVLRNTKAPAMLIECSFVDDKDDAKRWNASKCAKAIYEAITNTTLVESKPVNNIAVVKFMSAEPHNREEFFMNVYKDDVYEKTGAVSYYNRLLTIGSSGDRNIYTKFDKEKKVAYGQTKGTFKKGTVIVVKQVSGGNVKSN